MTDTPVVEEFKRRFKEEFERNVGRPMWPHESKQIEEVQSIVTRENNHNFMLKDFIDSITPFDWSILVHFRISFTIVFFRFHSYIDIDQEDLDIAVLRQRVLISSLELNTTGRFERDPRGTRDNRIFQFFEKIRKKAAIASKSSQDLEDYDTITDDMLKKIRFLIIENLNTDLSTVIGPVHELTAFDITRKLDHMRRIYSGRVKVSLGRFKLNIKGFMVNRWSLDIGDFLKKTGAEFDGRDQTIFELKYRTIFILVQLLFRLGEDSIRAEDLNNLQDRDWLETVTYFFLIESNEIANFVDRLTGDQILKVVASQSIVPMIKSTSTISTEVASLEVPVQFFTPDSFKEYIKENERLLVPGIDKKIFVKRYLTTLYGIDTLRYLGFVTNNSYELILFELMKWRNAGLRCVGGRCEPNILENTINIVENVVALVDVGTNKVLDGSMKQDILDAAKFLNQAREDTLNQVNTGLAIIGTIGALFVISKVL